jgi:hypothetical protein
VKKVTVIPLKENFLQKLAEEISKSWLRRSWDTISLPITP